MAIDYAVALSLWVSPAIDGTMYISDTRGMSGPGWETPGRIVRVSPDGSPIVIADGLPSPNGISFDESMSGLWVSQYNANRIDYLALKDDGTAVTAAYPGMHVDAGRARVDSNAVDAEGNVYQAFHGKSEIAVFDAKGELRQVIRISGAGLDSATNIAIAPGTRNGVVTASGSAGGFVYTFEALANGIRQSNGG